MRHLYLIFSLLLLAACSSAHVDTDYDRGVNFSQIKTYNYFSDIDWNGVNQLDQTRIVRAIDQELKAKSWQKSNHPQVLIDIKPSEQVVTNTNTVGIGTGSYGGGFGTSMQVGIPIKTKKLQKDLVIEMLDATNQHLIWQGVFSKEFSTRADSEKIIQSAIQDLFKKFPPKK
ncbi:DUF4136 domain-containing protein [Ornithobacterium rhinotracheale]|uniref:DUF4136 domain-containing protein n=1 Tax=Ornithobacterium rhinotracheale TaxID=28251 RepID=UPI001FF0F2D1|nr:DUF4136 domain-containing protein [Ornithobacterium rhinotracheale]MCK0202847.1 DUF4136 domain-containing protein [Ornithobacterium rhinotracheale]MCK0206261.1 DUF4136 domain-containing protein [Ornithobacterium rhinotracheale]